MSAHCAVPPWRMPGMDAARKKPRNKLLTRSASYYRSWVFKTKLARLGTRHEYPYVICTVIVPGPRKNVPGPGKKYSAHTDLLEHVNYGKKKKGLRRNMYIMYRYPFCTILNHFGPFWTVLDLFGSFLDEILIKVL